MRLHTAAYWLMLTLRDAIPKAHALAKPEFAAIRLRLIKLGARVIETASRIRLAFLSVLVATAISALLFIPVTMAYIRDSHDNYEKTGNCPAIKG